MSRRHIFAPLAMAVCPACGADDVRRLWRRVGSPLETRCCGSCNHSWLETPAATWIAEPGCAPRLVLAGGDDDQQLVGAVASVIRSD